MRLDDEQESSNYEVQDGRGGGGLGGGGLGGGLGMLLPLIGSRFGCGGIVVVLIIMVVMGMNPLSLIGGGGGGGQQVQTEKPASGQLTDVQRTSLKVLGSTERRWTDIFKAEGQQYPAGLLQPERPVGLRRGAIGDGAFLLPRRPAHLSGHRFLQGNGNALQRAGRFPDRVYHRA
jgi:predicted metalloprotease